MTIDVAIILSAIATMIAISGWATTWRKAVMAEGKHLKEVEEVVKRMGEIEKEEEYLRGCAEQNRLGIQKLSTDIEWIKGALNEIKGMLKLKVSNE